MSENFQKKTFTRTKNQLKSNKKSVKKVSENLTEKRRNKPSLARKIS